MAFTPSSYLKSDDNVTLRDYQHAARIFVDDGFRLLPKTKFLFHVAFSINQAALKSIDLVQKHRNEINMLVKSVDLPKFTIQSEVLNQYNRKKVVQYQHKIDGITVSFHDDNMGLINQLWQNYYSYYYADSTSAKTGGAFNRNATRSSDFIKAPYGLDNRSSLPFFNYITIYQMARHEYVSYKLINPIITTWNHNKVDYAQGNTPHDNSMGLSFEAVEYGQGKIADNAPEGFGVEHYDKTKSPLGNVTGLTTASPTFSDKEALQAKAPEFLSSVTKQINTYQNTQNLNNAGTSGLLSNVSTVSTQGVSGLQVIAFPVAKTPSGTTVASQVKLG